MRAFAQPVNIVEAYRNEDVVARIAQEANYSPEEAEELFFVVKRFIWLSATSEEEISPPLWLDRGWHEFILFTEDYAEFCHDHFGRFIHHRPHRLNDPPDDGSSLRRLRELWQENFGYELPSAIGAQCTPVPSR